MNTLIQADRHALPIKMFTEAQVVESLKACADASGIPDLRLSISSNDAFGIGPCTATCFEPHYACSFQKTIAEAIEDLRRQIKSPSQIAAAKRAEAQRLNDEACALEAQHVIENFMKTP